MKQFIHAFAAFFLIGLNQVAAQSPSDSAASRYASSIKSADLSEYLHVLASDSLAGRETGQPGQKKAANYLASKFKDFGLLPVVKEPKENTYFQKFELISKAWEEVYIKAGGKKLTFLEDFYAYGDISFPEERKLAPVFAGYGIEHANYSDYKSINVKGKVVIIFAGEPVKDSISKLTGTKALSDWANDWRKKSEYARMKGAETVFMVVGNTDAEFKTRLTQLKHHIASLGLGFKDKDRASAIF
ncbi:MAG TPA: aminopeptidase, partial [Cytophagaceae bacterium]